MNKSATLVLFATMIFMATGAMSDGVLPKHNFKSSSSSSSLDSLDVTLKRITDLYQTMLGEEKERQLENAHNEVQSIEVRLEKLSFKLRSFVHESTVSFGEFANQEEELEIELLQLLEDFRESTRKPKRLTRQLRFARHFYDLLAEASKHHLSLVAPTDQYHSIVSSSYELRISVLVMFNNVGVPNRSIPNFNDKIACLNEKLHRFADERFKILSAAPSEVIRVVWNQFRKTERALEILSK